MGQDRRPLEGERMNYDEFDMIDPTSKAFRTLVRLLTAMRLSGFVMASYAIFQGVLIILGGRARFSQVGYITAMLLPGAPASWGVVLLIGGTLAFVGLKNRKYMIGATGMAICGVWSFAFGGAFLISAIQHSNANLTAMAAYGKDGVLFILMASVHRMMSHLPTKPEDDDA